MEYIYQKYNRYFAQAADDIKDIAEQELKELGASDTKQSYRGVYFNASPEVLYGVNFRSRLINRVLAPLLTFDCHSDKYLYKRAYEIEWSDILDPSKSMAIFATVSHSNIKHSKFAALRLKDAIVDYFRDKSGKRPDIDTQEPDVWLNLHIHKNQATISLDTSGGSLHRRGYRSSSILAPMMETLAAAIIDISGWDGRSELIDPFCGSGTLLCEAYLKSTNTPPGILRRKFGFEELPDFDSKTWTKVRQSGIDGITEMPAGMISGSDIDRQAAGAARENLKLIAGGTGFNIAREDIFEKDDIRDKTIICNPPYGLRLESETDLGPFYKKLGDFLKWHCQGSNAFIYFGDRSYLKNIGLRPSMKRPLANGGLDGRLAKFEIFQ